MTGVAVAFARRFFQCGELLFSRQRNQLRKHTGGVSTIGQRSTQQPARAAGVPSPTRSPGELQAELLQIRRVIQLAWGAESAPDAPVAAMQLLGVFCPGAFTATVEAAMSR